MRSPFAYTPRNRPLQAASPGAAVAYLGALLVVAFCLIQQLLLEVPLVGYILKPEATQGAVDGFRDWLARNGRRAGIGVAAVLGALLVVRGIAGLAHAQDNLLLAVDNTFLTPLLQDSLALGADISMLSTTKYIDGHNATIGGSLATHDAALTERLRLVRKTLGTIQAPFDAWLTLQGLKTLPARLNLHCGNAAQIAKWLEDHPKVAKVYYPGLESFPQRALAERQQKAFGGMLAFELDASTEDSLRFIDALKLCTCAESLGSVETLITNPATASHCDIPLDVRARLGVPDRLIRLSVGLEAPQDLIADFEQAFSSVFGGAR